MKNVPIEGISDNLNKAMTYLAQEAYKGLHDPALDAEDIYHDLIVLYLEKRRDMKIVPKNVDNYWFIIFKNYILNCFKRKGISPIIFTTLTETKYEELR